MGQPTVGSNPTPSALSLGAAPPLACARAPSPPGSLALARSVRSGGCEFESRPIRSAKCSAFELGTENASVIRPGLFRRYVCSDTTLPLCLAAFWRVVALRSASGMSVGAPWRVMSPANGSLYSQPTTPSSVTHTRHHTSLLVGARSLRGQGTELVDPPPLNTTFRAVDYLNADMRCSHCEPSARTTAHSCVLARCSMLGPSYRPSIDLMTSRSCSRLAWSLRTSMWKLVPRPSKFGGGPSGSGSPNTSASQCVCSPSQ